MKTITINQGKAHLVLKCVGRGEYKIVDNSLTVKNGDRLSDQTRLLFKSWDSTVENLEDPNSDIADVFKKSTHLKWGNVVLTTEIIKAASLWDITRAFQHVEVGTYCPGDI